MQGQLSPGSSCLRPEHASLPQVQELGWQSCDLCSSFYNPKQQCYGGGFSVPAWNRHTTCAGLVNDVAGFQA